MRNRKTRYGEQKILELIDKEMQSKSNLDYSQIKDQIIIDEKKGIEKVENNQNFIIVKLKYALSIILLIVSIVTYCTICTLNTKVIFETDYYLTDVLIEEYSKNGFYRKNENYFENTGILSIIAEHEKNEQYVELSIANNIDNKYYCAYLDKKIIKKVNDYFIEKNISNLDEFNNLYNKRLFFGIDLMLLKTYFYYKNNNINDLSKYLKWIEYDDDSFIKYEINNYQLIYFATINNVNNIVNISKDTKINKEINVYYELDFYINNNQVVIKSNDYKEKKDFLCKFSDIVDNNNISINYLFSYCSEIINCEDTLSVYINIPEWFDKYNDYIHNMYNENIKNNVKKVKFILNIIDSFKLDSKEIYDYIKEQYHDRYFYNYEKIKTHLLSQ